MANILKEFYENCMCTERRISGYDYGKYVGIMEDRDTKLSEMLDEKAKPLYEEFKDARDELSYENACESFAQGFTLGALLMEGILKAKADMFGE